MRKEGFSLIELLVVIAMITFLLAIAMPLLVIARQQARSICCASNIRQLFIGMNVYNAENQSLPPGFVDALSTSPPPGGYAGTMTHDSPGRWWFNYTTEYSELNSRSLSELWCPSRRVSDGALADDVLCGNYGVNQSICRVYGGFMPGRSPNAEFTGGPLSLDEIPYPSQTLLLVDSGYARATWWSATADAPGELGMKVKQACYIPGLTINSQKDIRPCQQLDACEGRHPGRKVNVAYADGRIVLIKADDLTVNKTDDSYQNRCPTWSPTD